MARIFIRLYHGGRVTSMNPILLLIFMVFSLNSLVEDIRFFRVHVYEIILGILIMAVAKLLLGFSDWTSSLIGGGLGGLSFWVIYKIAKGRLGAGDIWYSIFIGFTFGFWIWDIGMLIGAALAGLWIYIRWLRNKRFPIKNLKVPFLPFLFVGSVLTFVCKGRGA